MSAFLSEAADFVGLGPQLEALRDLLGLKGLKPGSFRGVPFHVADNERSGGRRVGVHEFPLRNEIATEDLGRSRREFTVTAYVIGDDWREQRDELLFACEESAKPGTLTLPFGFEMVVRCVTVKVMEAVRNVATLLITFVDAGGEQPGVAQQLNPAAVVRRALGRVLRLARAGFALAYATKDFGDFVQRAAISGLTGLGEQLSAAWLGLPGLDLAATARAIGNLGSADPENPAAAVVAPSRALANAALALPAAASASADPDAGTSRAEPAPSRREAAQALLAVATAPVTRPVVSPGVIARRVEANRVALDALNRDAATLMAAEVIAATEFSSLAEAEALRAALLEAIDRRADAAADAGDDEAFRGWRELAAAAARDLAERARRAPRLAAYAVPALLPSLALAQRLYGAGGRADELVGLNDVVHPAFMPLAGRALRP